MAHFRDYETGFREHYRTAYGGTSRNYNDYQPAYQYGYGLAENEDYRDRDWDEFKDEARADWEDENPDTAWEEVEDAIQHAWNEVKDAFD